MRIRLVIDLYFTLTVTSTQSLKFHATITSQPSLLVRKYSIFDVAIVCNCTVAPLLVIVYWWVDRGFGSWVLLGLFCLLRVTQLQPTQSCSTPYLHGTPAVAAGGTGHDDVVDMVWTATACVVSGVASIVNAYFMATDAGG